MNINKDTQTNKRRINLSLVWLILILTASFMTAGMELYKKINMTFQEMQSLIARLKDKK